MWIAIGIIVALAVVLYVYLTVTCFFTEVTFMTAYQTEFHASGSHANGLRAALNVFKGRAPFNVLTAKDLDRVVQVMSLIPDAQEAARIIRELDRKRDASLLANPAFLDRLERE